MASIGSFGNLVFSVSANTVKTFDNMSWNFSANYTTHDRHIRADLLEFMGPEISEISLDMAFSAFNGINPMNEINRLKNMVNQGRAERLVIGGKVYGDYKWVIQKGTVDLKYFDKGGNLLAAKAQITLKEYPKR